MLRKKLQASDGINVGSQSDLTEIEAGLVRLR